MSRRFRSTLLIAITGCLVLSLATPAFAARPSSFVRDARAEYLAEKSVRPVSSAGVGATILEETALTVASQVSYRDVDHNLCLDGIISAPEGQFFKDVWVGIEFRNKYGTVIATDEILSNEYVVSGKGTFSGYYPVLPSGTTKVVAVEAWGTVTDKAAYGLTAGNISVESMYPGDRSILLDATNSSTKALSDIVVSAIETTGTGSFLDVAVGYPDDSVSKWATEDYRAELGEAVPFSLWGARMTAAPTFQEYLLQGVEHSTVSLVASPTAVAYGKSVELTGTVLDSLGAPVADVPVLAVSSANKVIGEAVTDAEGAYKITTSALSSLTAIRALSLGTSYLASDWSDNSAKITVGAYMTTPSAPKYASYAKSFTSYTYLRPRHTAGTYPVLLKCYRLSGSTWVYSHSVKAKASNYSTYTKCTASVRLPKKGTWRIQAQHSDSGHSLTKTSVRTVYVR